MLAQSLRRDGNTQRMQGFLSSTPFYTMLLMVLCLGLSQVKTAVANDFSAPKNYKWMASIDRSAGVATSREVTYIIPPSQGWRPTVSHQQLCRISSNLFGSYPTWLAKGRVTLGLFRAVSTGNGIAVRDRVVGGSLLTFGPASFHSSHKTMESEKNDQKIDHHYKATKYTVTLPIVGGLLALGSPTGESGCLRFSIVLPDKGCNDMVMMETEIANGYRPAVAGPAPVSRMRAWTYRSTQSLYHAYIMGRFHRHCHEVLLPVLEASG